MPNTEELAKLVESKRKVKPWVEARVGGLHKLSQRARSIGCLLIGYSEKHRSRANREQAHRMRTHGAKQLMHLPDDIDLIVSVAHRGGVDPEASASTVEMRAALLRETIQLLKLNNVKIKEPHVYISGSRAEYSVHLGSATTHMLLGGALFIVPVHSQHRGRIFLPFADDDPKTAEIMSKVLLLARDQEIKDPNLLEQIRARG